MFETYHMPISFPQLIQGVSYFFKYCPTMAGRRLLSKQQKRSMSQLF